MNIVIIAAMPEEFGAVACCLEPGTLTQLAGLKVFYSRSPAHKFMLLESGMGFVNAAEAAEIAIKEKCPDLLVSVGFCGGISPKLQNGDVVVAKRVVIVTSEGFEEVPVCFSDAGQTFVALQTGLRVFGGLFASTPTIMLKTKLAGILPADSPFPVVEMESAAIAIVAAENNIPLLAIRAVSDIATDELGFSLDELSGSNMRRIVLHKVLLTALGKPRIIPQLMRLAFSSRKAAASLSAALSRLFPAL